MSTMPIRALTGMVLIIAGGFIRGIGAKGLAGSGVILDPEQAREEMEPWARISGGLMKDTLDEVGLDLSELDLSKIGGGNTGSSGELPFDEQIRRLHKLYEDGLISEEEYQQEKIDILNSN